MGKSTKKSRKHIVSILTVAVFLLFPGCGAGELGNTISGVKIEISMEDAIALALSEGEKYYDDLSLTEVHSFDNDRDRSMDAGTDGNREYWYVNLANKEMNYVSILIKDGKITTTVNYDENGNTGLFAMDEVKMTCAEAVQRAKELGIRGGNPAVEEEWVSGYNFQLMHGSLVKAPDEKILMLGVIGISDNGNFARADFDATNGEIVIAEEKIEYADGSIEWRNLVTGDLLGGQEDQSSMDYENLSREDIQEEYHVFSLAREYLVDPEELTDAIVRGDNSPWSNLVVYEQAEWEKLMTERYGDIWKEW